MVAAISRVIHTQRSTCQTPNHSSLLLFSLPPARVQRGESRVGQSKGEQRLGMAAMMMSSLSLKPSPLAERRLAVKSLPTLPRRPSTFVVRAGAKKKLKTDKPYGISGGMKLRDGLDASGRKGKGKGVYQFVDKYGANVDGYSPIYDTRDWSPGGDVYTGGTTGLLIWAITLGGVLLGGALLVYNTSALSQ